MIRAYIANLFSWEIIKETQLRKTSTPLIMPCHFTSSLKDPGRDSKPSGERPGAVIGVGHHQAIIEILRVGIRIIGKINLGRRWTVKNLPLCLHHLPPQQSPPRCLWISTDQCLEWPNPIIPAFCVAFHVSTAWIAPFHGHVKPRNICEARSWEKLQTSILLLWFSA